MITSESLGQTERLPPCTAELLRAEVRYSDVEEQSDKYLAEKSVMLVDLRWPLPLGEGSRFDLGVDGTPFASADEVYPPWQPLLVVDRNADVAIAFHTSNKIQEACSLFSLHIPQLWK